MIIQSEKSIEQYYNEFIIFFRRLTISYIVVIYEIPNYIYNFHKV